MTEFIYVVTNLEQDYTGFDLQREYIVGAQ